MLRFLVAEALRDLRRGGLIAVSAIALTTLSLGALGGFGVLSANIDQAVRQWRDRVRVIVYLKRDPADPAALVRRVEAVPGVASARYVDRTSALAALRKTLGRDGAVIDQLSANPLPASVEITPAPGAATKQGASVLLERLAGLPDVEDVAGGLDWVERLAHWRRMLGSIAFVVGGLLAVGAILTVTTATTLVLHVRRDETDIMRLVGAPEYVIRLPLLMQGALQGLVGALVAVAALVAAHHVLAPRLEPLVALTLGLPRLTFLPPAAIGGLVLGGTMLGGFGGLLARRRGHV